MKVAIPLFKDRISPRFDVCPEIWIIELNNEEVINQEKCTMGGFNLQQRLDQLTSKRVDKIICGGIDNFCMDHLGKIGIDVIYNVAGQAREALNLFIKGVLQPGFYCDGKKEEPISFEKN
ncbi:MAG: NifB/NifX family molybdenum-iron cluster-binding protein [Syntrophaceae bacterium]|nr:NifB/NifX family molybdenum-iron cluster-binding protein [Syntrophaceae bacterium]